jgi:hypothetical protein
LFHRTSRAALGLLVIAASPASAQLAPAGVPKGTVRIDLRGEFQSVSSRYLHGTKEEYLADFASPALGADRFAAVRAADSLIALIVGGTANRINLGRTTAVGQRVTGTATIGVSLGLTSRLTLFLNVPLVETRVQAKVTVDSSTALAGLNPAHPTLGTAAGQADAARFFQQFTAALDTLNRRIASGFYSGPQDALARAIAARGTAMQAALLQLTSDPLAASPFLPTDTSAAGRAIAGAIAGLQDTLQNQLGVTGFTDAPVLAAVPFTTAQYQALLTDPRGPVAGAPLAAPTLQRLGDIDVGATYTVVDRWDRGRRWGGIRIAVTGLVRLPTGQRDSPHNFLDTGTGNGRYEAGASAIVDLGRGRPGARIAGGYLARLPARRVRRVAPPGEPIAFLDRLTNVQIDAGDVVTVRVQPYLRLARGFAIQGTAEYWRQGADQVTYARSADSVPGVAASLLGRQSRRSALVLGAGVSYVGRSALECTPGRKCGLPIEAGWTWSTVARATGGRVEKVRATALEIRWYHRLWR